MVKKEQKLSKGEIIIYKPQKGEVELSVKLENDTIWLNTRQMASLFGVNRPAVVKHINNIYKTEELNKKSTCSILEQVAFDGRKRKINLYNFDIIISVGYRVNSKEATNFRVWATKILKNYLIRGYAINNDRLLEAQEKFNELQNVISFLKKKSDNERLESQKGEILDLLADYSKTLTLLENYDKDQLKELKGRKDKKKIKYEDCLDIIVKIKKNLVSKKEAGDIFGRERGGEFEGIIKGLYQTFDSEELYKSIEDKASHLLYLIIKDHPFTDGNKRIAKNQDVKPGTIVNHIEKLIDEGEKLDLEYLKLPRDRYEAMKAAFEEIGDERLKPVFEHLKGKFDYDELKLVRVIK